MARLTLVAVPALWLSGCTFALWEEDRFAHIHQPASPSGLELYYSGQRQEVLVRFNESKEGDPTVRSRAYWLEPNAKRINRHQKPRFVSFERTSGLVSIPLADEGSAPEPPSPDALSGVVSTNSEYFTLRSGSRKLSEQKLPVYYGEPSRRVAQVALTPLALMVDGTIVGAAIVVIFPQVVPALIGPAAGDGPPKRPGK